MTLTEEARMLKFVRAALEAGLKCVTFYGVDDAPPERVRRWVGACVTCGCSLWETENGEGGHDSDCSHPDAVAARNSAVGESQRSQSPRRPQERAAKQSAPREDRRSPYRGDRRR